MSSEKYIIPVIFTESASSSAMQSDTSVTQISLSWRSEWVKWKILHKSGEFVSPVSVL